VAEGAHPAKGAGCDPGEILPETTNMVLDKEEIFKPLLSEYLTILSYSSMCQQEGEVWSF